MFTKENLINIPETTQYTVPQLLEEVDITEEDIRKRLKSLNPSKSPGPDGVHPRILKVLADTIARPISDIFRTSLQEGKLPETGKWPM